MINVMNVLVKDDEVKIGIMVKVIIVGYRR